MTKQLDSLKEILKVSKQNLKTFEDAQKSRLATYLFDIRSSGYATAEDKEKELSNLQYNQGTIEELQIIIQKLEKVLNEE